MIRRAGTIISIMVRIQDICKSKGVHFFHANVRSMKGKWPRLKPEIARRNLDIISFSESWLKERDLSSKYNIFGYNSYRLDRRVKKKAGGLITYVNEEMFCSTTMFENLNRSNKDIEIQWLLLSKGKSKKFIFANVYRPPNGSANNFVTVMTSLLTQVNDLQEYKVFLMGDFNINCLRDNNEYETLTEALGEFHLRQLIKQPTRVVKDANGLDLIFTNTEEIVASGVVSMSASDHMPVFVTFKHKCYKIGTKTIHGRSYKKYDKDVFANRLVNYDWSELDNLPNVEEAWNVFETIINKLLDIDCPIHAFRVKDEDDPWMTHELLKKIEYKNKLLRKAKKV